MIIAILMGRKGSKGFPGKNLYNVLGRPLAYYPMKAALDCSGIDKIYLSTDDEELMQLAKKNKIEVIRRPESLCTDQALGDAVYAHAYTEAKQRNKGQEIELIVLLMCNAASITGETILEGIQILKQHPEYDSCVTVSKYNMWSPLRARKVNAHGLLEPFVHFKAFGDPKTLNCDRDSQGDVWFADMGVSIIRPRCLKDIEDGLLPQKWMGRKIYPLKQWGGLDIDFQWQVPLLEHWLKKNGYTETGLKSHLRDLERTVFSGIKRKGYLRLDMNESPQGLSKDFIKKALSRIDSATLATYPEYSSIQDKIAKGDRIAPENICLSAGSDSAIKYMFDAYISYGDKVLLTEPSFAMYEVYCRMFNAQSITVKYGPDLKFPLGDFMKMLSSGVKMAVVVNPNNPTGSVLAYEDLIKVIKEAAANNVLLIVDEAYFHFYPETVISEIKKYKNLVVLRTFSKLCGMAGLRLGYAAASRDIIEHLKKVRPSFEVNSIALLFAEELLAKPVLIKRLIRQTKEGKDYLINRLKEEGISYRDSYANFILIDCAGQQDEIIKKLAKKKILVAGHFKQDYLKDYIRVTTGDKKIMLKFWSAFKKIWRKK